MKAGSKGPPFSATCERCMSHSEKCRTVLFFDTRTYETLRILKIMCPGCRNPRLANGDGQSRRARMRNWKEDTGIKKH